MLLLRHFIRCDSSPVLGRIMKVSTCHFGTRPEIPTNLLTQSTSINHLLPSFLHHHQTLSLFGDRIPLLSLLTLCQVVAISIQNVLPALSTARRLPPAVIVRIAVTLVYRLHVFRTFLKGIILI